MFPVPGVKAVANWACDWSIDDDAALMVGLWRHGLGAWEAIQKDSSLGLKKKFFLEDAKVKGGDSRSLPNSIHLVRRADYLCHLLQDFDSARSYKEKPSKVVRDRKSKPPSQPVAGSSATPKRKSTSKAAVAKPASKPKRKTTPAYSDSEASDATAYESMDDAACKETLRPVRHELKRLKTTSTESLTREERIAIYKECLTAIGSRIASAKDALSQKEDRDRIEKHLCTSAPPHLAFTADGRLQGFGHQHSGQQ